MLAEYCRVIHFLEGRIAVSDVFGRAKGQFECRNRTRKHIRQRGSAPGNELFWIGVVQKLKR